MKHLLQAARPILLDLASTLVFLIVIGLSGQVIVATLLAVMAGVAKVVFDLARRRPIGALQWMSLALVVVMGSATLLTHDPRFVMAKPTLIYAAVGATMLKRGWMEPYMPQVAVGRMAPGALVSWGYAWAGLMFVTAIANLTVALTVAPRAWSLFMVVFPTVSKVALFAAQYVTMRAHVVRRIRAGLVSAPA